MRRNNKLKSSGAPDVQKQARRFFANVQKDSRSRPLLGEQNHRIEFDLTDGEPFYVEVKNGRVSVKRGSYSPRRFDSPDLIHFQLATATLQRLFNGQLRFTDALIPVDPEGRNRMLLLECGLFKWSVLNWVGRIFRVGQLPERFRD